MAASASHDGTQQFISDDWTNHVDKLLEEEEIHEVSRATTRVPMAIVNAKAEAYVPQILSLGPHHHLTFKVGSSGPFEQPITQMDMYKLRFAREAAGRKANVIKQIAAELTKPPLMKKVEDFYDWKIPSKNTKELRNLSMMMTVDAFFLFQFLKKYFYDERCMPFISCVRCDILKLENQIPLFLLLKANDAVSAQPHQPQQSGQPQQQKFDLQSRIKSLSTFQIRRGATNILEGEEHLLGCIHKYVSSFLQIPYPEENKSSPSRRERIVSKTGSVAGPVGCILGQHSEAGESQQDQHDFLKGQQDQHDFVKRYNAEELVKAGIRFKPLSDDPSSKIRFDIISRTLYLPKIEVVGNYTEVMLRNLLALELNEPNRPKAVTNYVSLMDTLIDTPKDVGLLRVRGIIVWRDMMITNEYVAVMWNEMSKPLMGAAMGAAMGAPFALKSQIHQLLSANFCITKFKTLSWEFSKLYFSKPWHVVGLLVRIFLVLVVQFMFVGQYSLGWPKFKWRCPPSK